VVVSEAVPAGLAVISATPSGGSFDTATGTWSIGPLPTGATAELEVRTVASAIGFQGNSAVITDAGVTDPDGSNNSAQAGVQVAAVPPPPLDISLATAAAVAAPTATGAATRGGTVTFTLSADNDGPSDATGVTVSAVLPAGFDFVSASGAYDPQTRMWTIGSLPAGGTAVLTVTAQAAGPPGTYSSWAALVGVDQTDTNSQNNSASAGVEVEAAADLRVVKTVAPEVARIGDTVTYTVTVTNHGPDDDTGIQLVETSREDATFTDVRISQGTFDAAARIWTVGNLASGASASIEVDVLITRPASVINRAVVAAADLPDPTFDNNEDTATLSVPGADLSVTKNVDLPAPTAGATVSFTVAVANAGPDAAQGVDLADPLPADLAFVSAEVSKGSYDPATGRWAVGDLDPGAVATMTVHAVAGTAPTTNTATVSAAGPPDPVGGNNVAAVTATPQVPPAAPSPPDPPPHDAPPPPADDFPPTATPPPASSLPPTGSAARLPEIGGTLLAAGTALAVAGRITQRRPRRHRRGRAQ
jgi:uncharacterized repeat protein (TIGR01451 family)